MNGHMSIRYLIRDVARAQARRGPFRFSGLDSSIPWAGERWDRMAESVACEADRGCRLASEAILTKENPDDR
jgi:hypothetical protein